ncbi:hypothetical protein [Nocardioides yefusunii]|uniref:Uncharacterized protein n=1 Tax=Nocardioides yefusunii TaxID=2500546 RepID=A0ABW1QVS1_9ACTN|nr:hypothetical protein [Nocardioides yefusunii]
MSPLSPETARLLVVAEDPTALALPDDAARLTVVAQNADQVSDSLDDLLAPLTSLEVVLLVGPLASETWRRHGAFQLHLTLIDAPTAEHVPGALAGALAMLG